MQDGDTKGLVTSWVALFLIGTREEQRKGLFLGNDPWIWMMFVFKGKAEVSMLIMK